MTKLILETSIREARLTQDVLKDINLERIFDLTIEAVMTNVWILDVEHEDVMEDIENLLKECGLTEFTLEMY